MSVSQKTKTIVFLEFIDEAKIFFAKYGKILSQNPQYIKIITFHPLVRSYFADKNIECTDSFYLCSKDNHHKMIEVLKGFSEQVRSECCLTDSIGIQTTYVEDLIFYMRIMVSHLLYRIEVIHQGIKKYNPKKIITIGTRHIKVSRSLFIDSYERYVDPIILQIAKVKDIEVDRLTRPESEHSLAKFQPIVDKLISMLNFIIATVATIRIDRSDKLVLAPSKSFHMDRLLKKMQNQTGDAVQYGIMSLDLKNATIKAIKQFLGYKTKLLYVPVSPKLGIQRDRNFSRLKRHFNSTLLRIIKQWNYHDVHIGEFIRKKYHKSFEPLIIDAIRHNATEINNFLKKWQPDFIFAQYSRRMSSVLGELASQSGLQTMIIPHGTFVPSTDYYSRLEWQENALGIVNTPYSSVALQTPLIEKFIQENDISKNCIITGPLLFGQKIEKKRCSVQIRSRYSCNGEQILLHAGTPKIRRGTRLLNYETIDEYVDGIISLIDATRHIKDVHLIIRFREIDGLDTTTLKGLLPKGKHYSIASDGDFQDYLSIADLLISFSSTTIEEALQNDIPVMLYNKYGRYVHIQGVTLNENRLPNLTPSAVYNVNCEEDLVFGLNWVLSNHLHMDINPVPLFDVYKYNQSKMIELVDLFHSGGSASLSQKESDIPN